MPSSGRFLIRKTRVVMTVHTQLQCSTTCSMASNAKTQSEPNCTSRHWLNDSPQSCQPSASVGGGKTNWSMVETQIRNDTARNSEASIQKLSSIRDGFGTLGLGSGSFCGAVTVSASVFSGIGMVSIGTNNFLG
jgi:hypothetical protein